MAAKLGLADSRETDKALIESVLKLLAAGRVDYTIFWRRLSQGVAGAGMEAVRDMFADRPALDGWIEAYLQRLESSSRPAAAQRMLGTNPKYVLRNHLGEQAIQKAKLKDWSEVTTLLALLENPFDEHPSHDAHAALPPDWASGIEISCSS